jgi:hypothetical protein
MLVWHIPFFPLENSLTSPEFREQPGYTDILIPLRFPSQHGEAAKRRDKTQADTYFA